MHVEMNIPTLAYFQTGVTRNIKACCGGFDKLDLGRYFMGGRMSLR
jgi:hypothetical protein